MASWYLSMTRTEDEAIQLSVVSERPYEITVIGKFSGDDAEQRAEAFRRLAWAPAWLPSSTAAYFSVAQHGSPPGTLVDLIVAQTSVPVDQACRMADEGYRDMPDPQPAKATDDNADAIVSDSRKVAFTPEQDDVMALVSTPVISKWTVDECLRVRSHLERRIDDLRADMTPEQRFGVTEERWRTVTEQTKDRLAAPETPDSLAVAEQIAKLDDNGISDEMVKHAAEKAGDPEHTMCDHMGGDCVHYNAVILAVKAENQFAERGNAG